MKPTPEQIKKWCSKAGRRSALNKRLLKLEKDRVKVKL